MVVPFIEVLHLPSSSSFYAAVLQPLALEYLISQSQDRNPFAHDQDQESATTSLVYGTQGRPVLQIRQTRSPLGPRKYSSLVLTAPSRSGVGAFFDCALRANPALVPTHTQSPQNIIPQDQGPRQGFATGSCRDAWAVHHLYTANGDEARFSPRHAHRHSQHQIQARVPDDAQPIAINSRSHPQLATLETRDGITSAAVNDLCGNRIEVIYPDPQGHSLSGDPARIIAWQFDGRNPPVSSSQRSDIVATHATPSPAMMPTYSHPVHENIEEPRSTHSTSQRNDNPFAGLNTTTVFGALLGAAAGAALTYGVVSREKSPPARRQVDVTYKPPPITRRALPPRRATFQEFDRRQSPEDLESLRSGSDAGSGMSRRYPSARMAYGDVVNDYEHAWPPPRFITQSSHRSDGASSRSSKMVARSRYIDDDDDNDHHSARGRQSVHSGSRRAASVRSRSETPVLRSIVHAEADPRHYTQVRRSSVSRPSRSSAHSRTSGHSPDHETFVSARTQGTAVTARPPPSESRPPPVQYDVGRSRRAGSRGRSDADRNPDSSSRRSSRRPASQGPSHTSARNISLPMSGIGSSHANWDDDLESVAPSDSISCVGSKSSHRSRSHRRH